jgi:GNAT superfamily N-acetyltransferase
MQIVLSQKPSREDRAAILQPLTQFNRAQGGPANWKRMAVLIKDAEGQTTGGLIGHTGYGWLFIELMFVPEALRKTGVGREVIGAALDHARAQGCVGAWVDTFSFQARGFYEKLGFRLFGELPNYPVGPRYFLQREL